jgi:hypothetical protein
MDGPLMTSAIELVAAPFARWSRMSDGDMSLMCDGDCPCRRTHHPWLHSRSKTSQLRRHGPRARKNST